MFLRILFLVLIGYILFTLIRLFLFINDNSKFGTNSGKNKINEERSKRSRFSTNNKIIELDEDQYKVE